MHLINGVLLSFNLCRISQHLLLFFLLGLAISCAPSHDPVGLAPAADKVLDQKILALLATPDKILYQDVNELVLNDSCVKCHNPQKKFSGVDLSSYKALLGQDSKSTIFPFEPQESLLYQTLIANSGIRQMPPMSELPLTESQKSLVFEWIKNGAKEELDSTEPLPLTLEQQLKPFFDQPQIIDYPIIQKYVFNDGSCLQCHTDSGATPQSDAMLFGADLNSYESLSYLNGIVKGLPYDVPQKNPDGTYTMQWGSSIYRSVAITQSMPPPRRGYQPLSALRVKLLRLWILNCAIKDFDAIENDQLTATPNSQGKIRNCQ